MNLDFISQENVKAIVWSATLLLKVADGQMVWKCENLIRRRLNSNANRWECEKDRFICCSFVFLCPHQLGLSAGSQIESLLNHLVPFLSIHPASPDNSVMSWFTLNGVFCTQWSFQAVLPAKRYPNPITFTLTLDLIMSFSTGGWTKDPLLFFVPVSEVVSGFNLHCVTSYYCWVIEDNHNCFT